MDDMKIAVVGSRTYENARKIKEFIYIAIDTATTHLHKEADRIHIRNALKHGATKEEILEVLQCTSILGMHALTEGAPMLRKLVNEK